MTAGEPIVLKNKNDRGWGKVLQRSHNIWRGNSIFYEKADYMALREITLSYNLPKQWTKALQMSNASVYLTGQNLFYITGYDGASPEPSDGFDYGRYPSPRTLIFGLNITF